MQQTGRYLILGVYYAMPQGDMLQVAASLHLPEAAKRINPDASFSGRPAATPQPLGNHAKAISQRSAEELLTALRKVQPLLSPRLHSLGNLQQAAIAVLPAIRKVTLTLPCILVVQTDFIAMALLQGTDLLKHGRLGKPKMHFFRLADADTLLTWRSANGKPRGIALSSVKQVTRRPIPSSPSRLHANILHAKQLAVALQSPNFQHDILRLRVESG